MPILRREQPLDSTNLRGMVSERGKPTPAMRELAGSALRLACLVAVAGGREVMQTEQLPSLGRLGKIERLGKRGCRGEELLPLEVALSAISDRAEADRPRRPFIVVLDLKRIGFIHGIRVDTRLAP